MSTDPNLSQKKYPEITLSKFLNNLLSKSQFNKFLRKYPVLKKILDKIIVQHEGYLIDLFVRLELDFKEIQDAFNLHRYELNSIKLMGDSHCMGRRVAEITFLNAEKKAKKIIYKPRSISLEKYYNKFLGFINAQGLVNHLQTLTIISKKLYGWTEHVEQLGIDKDLAHIYYYKLGVLLGICYSINGQDIHFENLIASGENPVIIDLECLFSPPLTQAQHEDKYSPSIFETFLIPHIADDTKSNYDFSAMLNHSDQKSFLNSFEIKGDFINKVYVVRSTVTISPQKNVLVDIATGRSISASKYSSIIAEGYSHYMSLLINNRAIFVQFITRNFKKLNNRLLFRPTFAYTKILSESYHPVLLSSHEKYQEYLRQLGKGDNELHQAIYEHEVLDLLNGDIPYFTTSTNGTMVKNSRNKKIKLETYCAGLRRVVDKINLLDEGHMINTKNQILIALRDRYA